MFASLLPNSKNLKEKDILEFPWEHEQEEFSELQQQVLLDEVEMVKNFYLELDRKKAANES
jgi:hypothetical protein